MQWQAPQREFLPALTDYKGIRLVEKAAETETTGVCFLSIVQTQEMALGPAPLVMINHSAQQNRK